MAEYVTPELSIRVASVVVPITVNGPDLHTYTKDNFSEALEIEHTFHYHGKPIVVRWLTYLAYAHTGNYR